MNLNALEFLKANRICVLATELADGAPHAATVHFAHAENPLKLYVLTERDSRKCAGLLDGAPKRGSLVIGFTEGKGATLQFDGSVRMILDKDRFDVAKEAYNGKFPQEDKEAFFSDPGSVFIEFTPRIWQFTDYRVEPRARESGSL